MIFRSSLVEKPLAQIKLATLLSLFATALRLGIERIPEKRLGSGNALL